MTEPNFDINDLQAIQNRSDFLNNFKKADRFKSALKHGFVGTTLTSVATAITAGTLTGTGIITTSFITFSLFAPVIAGIAGILIVSFLTGLAARYLYTPSKAYADFYKEFEWDKDGLFIETNKKNTERQNFISQNQSINKWESICSANKKTLELWKDEDRLKNIYKEKIFQAIKSNDNKKVLQLYNSKFNNYIKDKKDKDGNTLLHLAVEKGYKKIAEQLIENGTDINAANINGDTPLHKASVGGNKKIVSILLKIGADLHTANKDGKTPLQLAEEKKQYHIIKLIKEEIKKRNKLFQDVRDGDLTKIVGNKDLTKAKEINSYNLRIKDEKGNTFLHLSSGMGYTKISDLLIKAGADIHAINQDGYTPLHYAAENGNNETVKLLLNNGADTNLRNKETIKILFPNGTEIKTTTAGAVEILLKKGVDIDNLNKEAVETLLRNGADTHAKKKEAVKILLKDGTEISAANTKGKTPLQLAQAKNKVFGVKLIKEETQKRNKIFEKAKNGQLELENIEINDYILRIRDKEGNSLLHIMAENRDTEKLKLLLDKGADVNVANLSGITPLHLAVAFNRDHDLDDGNETAEMLLERGADVNAKSAANDTPLHLAVCFNYAPTIQTLISRGADINAKTIDGNTPLHVLAKYNYKEAVEILLKNGADVYAINNCNEAPVNVASQYNNQEIVNLIEEETQKRNQIFEKAKNGELKLETIEINDYLLRIKDEKGNSLLHIMAENGKKKEVEILLNKGADIHATNEEEETPLQLARKNNQTRIIALLEAKQKLIKLPASDIKYQSL